VLRLNTTVEMGLIKSLIGERKP